MVSCLWKYSLVWKSCILVVWRQALINEKKIRYLLQVVARDPVISLSQRLTIQMHLDPQADKLRLWQSAERLRKSIWAHLQGDRYVNLYSAKTGFSICNQGLGVYLTPGWSIPRCYYKLYLFHLVSYTFGSCISKGGARSQLSAWSFNYFLSTICVFFCSVKDYCFWHHIGFWTCVQLQTNVSLCFQSGSSFVLSWHTVPFSE